MKKWRIFILIVLAVVLFFILYSCWNRYMARELANEYVRKTYNGVEFKLHWPRYYSSLFTDQKEYHVVGEAQIGGRKFNFLVVVNHRRTKVLGSNLVSSRFSGEIGAYLQQRLQPIVGQAELKVSTNGGSFLRSEDVKQYYLAPLEEVMDKFSYLPDVGIKWRGEEELTDGQLYNICMSMAEALRQEQFSIGGLDFRYFTDKYVHILSGYGLDSGKDTPREKVMKRINKYEISPEGQKPQYKF